MNEIRAVWSKDDARSLRESLRGWRKWNTYNPNGADRLTIRIVREMLTAANENDLLQKFCDATNNRSSLVLVNRLLRCVVCSYCRLRVVPTTDRVCKVCSKTPEGRQLKFDLAKAKRAKTNLEVYGHPVTGQSEASKKKRMATNLAKYGTAYAIGSKVIRDKIHAANQERYGVNVPFQSHKIRSKAKRTLVNKYGVGNPEFVPGVKERKIARFKERYGVDHPLRNEAVKAKARQAVEAKYGGFTMASPELRKKVQRTNREKYGADWFFGSAAGKEAAVVGNMTKFGVPYATMSPVVKRKTAETNLQRYGVRCALSAPVVKRKIRKTNLQRYGAANPMQNADIHRKAMGSAFRIHSAYVNGRTVEYQGFELRALKALERKYGKQSVLTQFETGKTRIELLDGRSSTLDLYCKKNKTIYEVKSIWTITGRDSWLDKNRLIQRSANAAGLKVRFLVVFPRKKVVVLPSCWYRWSRKKLQRYLEAKVDG